VKVKNSGQALVEFAFFSIFSAGFIGIAGSILKEEWDRSKCAYLTFEGTHHYLVSGLINLPVNLGHGFLFQVEDLGDQILGIGQCGNHIEKVRLPRLETAKW
jgi:hypothetical protein